MFFFLLHELYFLLAVATLGKLTVLVFEKPGEKKNFLNVTGLNFFCGWTQSRLSQSYSMSRGFVFSLAWVAHNVCLKVTDKI